MNIFQLSILLTFSAFTQRTIEQIVDMTKLPFNAIIKGLKGFIEPQILTTSTVILKEKNLQFF